MLGGGVERGWSFDGDGTVGFVILSAAKDLLDLE
jgi:hypothetical protein